MDINYVALIGLIAGIFTTVSFLPQLIKTVKTKETKDLSLSMYIVLAAGLFLWMIYGFFIHSLPIIMANAISFVFAVMILTFKIKYR